MGLRSLAARLPQPIRRAGGALWRTGDEFIADGCPKLAAAISYYALFALFPLVILLVGVAGLVLDDQAAREPIIDEVLDRVPLREDRGRADLEELLVTVTESAGAIGVVGAAGLMVSASGLMGAIRFALNSVWRVEDRRPPLRGKALDVLMVLLAGLVVGLSLGLSFVLQALPAGVAAARVVPLALAFGVFAALYRFIPNRPVTLSQVVPGALLAAAGYEAVKTGFAFYLSNLASIDAVYASLATVVAFLLFVWVTANVFLFGAEMAAGADRTRARPEATAIRPATRKP